jgi:hypothetical protein
MSNEIGSNWRAKFKAEPQPPVRKLLYRRRGLSHPVSHTPSHSVSHSLSHMTYGRRGADRAAGTRGASAEVQWSGQTPDRGAGGAAWRQPVGGGASLWDSGACPVPLGAGPDSGGTAVPGKLTGIAVEIVDATRPTEEHTL